MAFRSLLSPSRLYSLHPGSKFEGFYSRFTLPSGAYLILIPCTVPAARHQAHSITLIYVPHPDSSAQFYQTEIVDTPITTHRHADDSFSLVADSTPLLAYDPSTSTITYHLTRPDLTFTATSTRPHSWSRTTPTPESYLALLPLPLHWHVHSLASPTTFTLALPPSVCLPPEDQTGTCTVHEEKNWAHSFPTAHHWILARDPPTGATLALAGGQILGVEAYLAGYRDPLSGLDLDFRPPCAINILGFHPFLSIRRNWSRRHLQLTLSSWRHKIHIHASAPPPSFFTLSEPFPEGFRANWLAQSLDAVVRVRVYKRCWRRWGQWELVAGRVFSRAGLEFGGAYYPERG